MRKNRRAQKLRAIEYLGGKCVKCGGRFHPAAFDFHHLNPSEKGSTLGQISGLSWKRFKAELDKCVLICSNCHREVEADY